MDTWLKTGLDSNKLIQDYLPVYKQDAYQQYNHLNQNVLLNPIEDGKYTSIRIFPCCPGQFGLQALWLFLQEASWNKEDSHLVNQLMCHFATGIPYDPSEPADQVSQILRYLDNLTRTVWGRVLLKKLLPLLGRLTELLENLNQLDEQTFTNLAQILVQNPQHAETIMNVLTELIKTDAELAKNLLNHPKLLNKLVTNYRQNYPLNLLSLAAVLLANPWLQTLLTSDRGLPPDLVLLLAIALDHDSWGIIVTNDTRGQFTEVHDFLSAFLEEHLVTNHDVSLDHEYLAWVITAILTDQNYDIFSALVFGIHHPSELGLIPVLKLLKHANMMYENNITKGEIFLKLFQIIRRPELVKIITFIECSNSVYSKMMMLPYPEDLLRMMTKPREVKEWVFGWVVLTNLQFMQKSPLPINPKLVDFINNCLASYVILQTQLVELIASDLQVHFSELANLNTVNAIYSYLNRRFQQGQLPLPVIPEIIFTAVSLDSPPQGQVVRALQSPAVLPEYKCTKKK